MLRTWASTVLGLTKSRWQMGLVGASLSHEGQHLPFPPGQLLERVAGPAPADELGDHLGVDHRPAAGDTVHRLDHLADVGDPVPK